MPDRALEFTSAILPMPVGDKSATGCQVTPPYCALIYIRMSPTNPPQRFQIRLLDLNCIHEFTGDPVALKHCIHVLCLDMPHTMLAQPGLEACPAPCL